MTIFLSIICIIVGFIMARYPDKVWELQHFLSVHDGEPTKLYLMACCGMGYVAMAAGILSIILNITGVL